VLKRSRDKLKSLKWWSVSFPLPRTPRHHRSQHPSLCLCLSVSLFLSSFIFQSLSFAAVVVAVVGSLSPYLPLVSSVFFQRQWVGFYHLLSLCRCFDTFFFFVLLLSLSILPSLLPSPLYGVPSGTVFATAPSHSKPSLLHMALSPCALCALTRT